MSEVTFNFCGVDSKRDLSLIVNNVNRPVTPEITENVQSVPGMLGSIFQTNSYGQKVITVDVTLKADDSRDRTQKYQALSHLFIQLGSNEFPLIFSDESEYTYYAHVSNVGQPQRLMPGSSWVTFTITFSCSDPKAYGEYQNIPLHSNPATILPKGEAECYPIFTCMPNKDVTKIAITDQNGVYVYVGSDVDPDSQDSPVDNEPLILRDFCNDLGPWTQVTSSNLTFQLENGAIEGSFRTTPSSIRVGTVNGKDDFGNHVEGKWHGPLMQRFLTSSLDDYRVRVRFWTSQSYARANGKIELYLLDSNGARIGKIALKDAANSYDVQAQIELGDNTNHEWLYWDDGTVKKGKSSSVTMKVKDKLVKVKLPGVMGSKPMTRTVQTWKTVTREGNTSTSTYSDFYGYLEVQKIGNKYRIEIMKLNSSGNPAWSKPIVKTWTDSQNKYANALAGVALYIGKYDIAEDVQSPPVSYANNVMECSDISIWEIVNGGNGSTTAPVTIARAGDELKINCEDRTIYKNGVPFMKNLQIGSDFPSMMGGIPKTFAFEPSLSDASWYYEYRPTKL
jgi:predicted phage tail component-like protein